LREVKHNRVLKTVFKLQSFFTKTKIFSLISFVLLLCLLYQFDSIYIQFRDKINSRIINYTGIDILTTVNNAGHTVDLIGKLKAIQNPIEDIDIIDLYISDASQKKLDKYLTVIPVKKNWVKASVGIEGKIYQCKIKYHGTDDAHYINNKYSYSIKLKDTTGHYNNAKRYKLIKGEEAEPTIVAANHLAYKMGLIAPVGKMKIVRINKEEVGHYYFTEDVKKGYLEREFGISNYAVLANVSDWTRKERAILGTPHISDLDLQKEHIKYDDDINHSKGIQIYGELTRLIEEDNTQEVIKYFDVEYIGKFLAIASLFNDVHFMVGDNLKLVYDFNRGKFYPIFRIEHAWRPLNNEIVPANGRKVNSFPDYNQILFESFPLYKSSINTRLFKQLLSDDNVRGARDKKLNELVLNKLKVAQNISEVHSDNEHIMLNTNICRKPYRIKKNEQLEFVSLMIGMASQYIKYNHVYGSYDIFNEKLSIINDGFSTIEMIRKADSLSLGKVSGIQFNSQLNMQYNKNEIELLDTCFKSKKYWFVNQLTLDTIANKHIHINGVDNSTPIKNLNTLSDLDKNNINYQISSDNITIQTGDYVVESNIVFQAKHNVKIEAGTKFSISPGKTMLFHSNVSIDGTKKKPVLVKNIEGKQEFGTFAIVGKQTKAIVKINNFHVSNGGETYFQGLLFTGQFAVYNANVSIKNSSFVSSTGDDGLNLKYCKVKLLDCSFESNKADQVDLDFCWALIENCNFTPSRIDPNGDGLDVSGSNTLVTNCKFNGFLDKGVSVGEHSSVYLFSNSFMNTKNAITIKDESNAYSWDNSFLTNEFNYSLFIKKKIFNKPNLFLEKNSNQNLINNIEGEVTEMEKSKLIELCEDFLFEYDKFDTRICLERLTQ
tara:strand:- start:8991 stop:11648 length:2658 start_codon:yes stop_codon:yes gene_type:complete